VRIAPETPSVTRPSRRASRRPSHPPAPVASRAAIGVLGALLLLGLAVRPAPAGPTTGVAWLPPSATQRLLAAGIPREPLHRALEAFRCARARGLFSDSTLTLIDYSRPSTQRRLWVIDALRGTVRFHEHVTHGRASGEDRASSFSNVEGSRQSSLGLFRTAETYYGAHGYSLRLDGLEPGVNDRARERAIVIHGADYATEDFAQRHGRLGRSWGCPAVDPEIHRDLIDTIRGGLLHKRCRKGRA